MNDEPVNPATAHSARYKKTRIQVIARAASLLRTLEHEPDGLSLSALAQRLKLPRSTVQRIVGALEAESLLIAASPTGRVKLGPALLRLSASAQTSAGVIARPFMTEIARDLGKSVDLSVLNRQLAIVVEQATGSNRSTVHTAIADKSPLHCTASGKSMLALLTDAEIESAIDLRYPPRTEFTHTSLSALLADIHEVRRTGLAYDIQEHTLGWCAVGVGFNDHAGNRMSLSITMASARFEEVKTKAAERLLELRNTLIGRLNLK